MGQDVDEQTFESSIAELAINTLKTQVPTLMPYALAFQLVERGDDDDRAIGFFGFRVGESLLYVPIFFLNGTIKGTELCYVVDEDRFVPLEDDWVNQLTKKKSFSIGQTASKDRRQQGITGPDLRRLRIPPSESKISADVGYSMENWRPWASMGMAMFACAEKARQIKSAASLPEFLARTGLTRGFLEDVANHPKLAQDLFTFHTADDFIEAEVVEVTRCEKNAAEQVAATPRKVPRRKIDILDSSDVANPFDLGFLSEEDKKKILRGNVVVSDGRLKSSTRRVFDFETTESLSNPSQSGIYDILTEAGEIARVLVAIPVSIGTGGTHDIRFVLDADGKYMLAPKTGIWCVDPPTPEEAKEALAKYGKSLASMDNWGTSKYVIVGGGNEPYVVGPFTVDSTVDNVDGTTTLFVRQEVPSFTGTEDRVGATQRSREGLPFDAALFTDDGVVNVTSNGERGRHMGDAYPKSSWSSVRRIIITDKPLKNHIVSNGIVMVPRNSEFRVVKLDEEMKGTSAPGGTADLYLHISKFAEAIDVLATGARYRVRTPEGTTEVMGEKAAYDLLCRKMNIHGDSAKILVKSAQDSAGIPVKYLLERHVKVAMPPWDLPDSQPHYDPLYDAPVQEGGMAQLHQLPEHASFDPGSSQVYRHFKDENNYQTMYSKDISNLNRAVSSQQKDVFDASAIASLAQVNDVSDEIEDYLPDLMRAVDKLGRLLFLFLWHGEDIQERFGKTEAGDLEDDIKNLFENLGETVLELKKSSPNTSDLFGSGIVGGGAGGGNAQH